MRIGLSVVVSIVALALVTPAAPAALSSTYNGPTKTLTVTSDGAGDSMVVTCPGANLLVGGADPPGGAIKCGEPSTLILIGNGGADTLDVSTVKEGSIGNITLDGGDGDDDITGVFFGSNGNDVVLLGGPGNDQLTVNGSKEARGGSGDDRIDGFAKGEVGSIGGTRALTPSGSISRLLRR